MVNQVTIPSNTTPLEDRQGRVTNPWYFYFKFLAAQAKQNSGVFVTDGSSISYAPSVLFQGDSAELSTFGTKGNIFFALDNGTIYTYQTLGWQAMIPAFAGDVSNPVGSNVLTLNTVNNNVGTFTNATVTVNEKGLVTAISNGSSGGGGGSVGTAGTIQFAGMSSGSFDGDQENFTYSFGGGGSTAQPTINLGSLDPLVTQTIFNMILTPGIGSISEINANTTLDLIGVEGLQLTTGSTVWVAIDPTGTLLLQGLAGTSGQVLTTQGAGTPPLWTSVVNSITGTAGQIDVSSPTGNVTISIDPAYEPTLTASEIGYGSGSNTLTGNPNFTFDGTNQVFIGAGGFGAIIANMGDTLFLSSFTEQNYIQVDDTFGCGFNGAYGTFNVDPTGALNLNSNPGTSGQVLTSQGPGTPPIWAAGGSSTTLTATYVGYGSASNLLTGSPDFTWNETSKQLTIGELTLDVSGTTLPVTLVINNASTPDLFIAPTGSTTSVTLANQEHSSIAQLQLNGGGAFLVAAGASLYNLAILPTGEVEVNSNSGTAGQVITSAGVGNPAVWADSSGGLTAINIIAGDHDDGLVTDTVTALIDFGTINIEATGVMDFGDVPEASTIASMACFAGDWDMGATTDTVTAIFDYGQTAAIPNFGMNFGAV